MESHNFFEIQLIAVFDKSDHAFAEPDNDPPQEMGDASKTELSEAESDAFDAKRSEAMAALGEGEWQKASELFTEAIKVPMDGWFLQSRTSSSHHLIIDDATLC